ETRCRDVGLGGMFIETTAPLPYGAAIRLYLPLPGLQAGAVIDATVRWSKADGMGVQFGTMGARETYALTLLLSGGWSQSRLEGDGDVDVAEVLGEAAGDGAAGAEDELGLDAGGETRAAGGPVGVEVDAQRGRDGIDAQRRGARLVAGVDLLAETALEPGADH